MQKLKDFLQNTITKSHWEKIGVFPHNGIVVPLFSLHSEKSSGIGEYLDLIPIIEWVKSIGMDTIQLLPLNETGKDPSPYNAISSCALNPIHISLRDLPNVENNRELFEKLDEFKIFNNYQRIPYPQIQRTKEAWLKEYYSFIEDDLKKEDSFITFVDQNISWLEEYALFRALKEKYDNKNWSLWPEKHQDIPKENFFELIEEYKNEIYFYYALQYFCYSQMSSVKTFAVKNNVLIEGDVPILVSANSCDVWNNREIFDMSHVAGAPPDNYSKYGQKWGFPLFNWDHLKGKDYFWWKRRLNVILPLYHMYRIDHVVGFFRLWCMLSDENATQGKFLPKDPTQWDEKGRERLTMMINSSPLLPMAEDLGLIPKLVYNALKDFGICGTKVIPWEKTLFGYIKYKNYEPLSVSTVSTHDSDTLAQWWEGYPKGSTKFARFKKWHYDPHLTYFQRKEILKDSHHTASIFHINLLQEYLALIPDFVWEDPDDERINVPGTLDPTNWTYRFRPSIEEIIANDTLAKEIREIIA